MQCQLATWSYTRTEKKSLDWVRQNTRPRRRKILLSPPPGSNDQPAHSNSDLLLRQVYSSSVRTLQPPNQTVANQRWSVGATQECGLRRGGVHLQAAATPPRLSRTPVKD